MFNILRKILTTGLVVWVGGWLYEEAIALYQMKATEIWCDGYLDAMESVREGRV